MKVAPLLSLVFLTSASIGAGEWSVTLVQRQLSSGNTYQTTVAAQGRQISLAPIPEGGSEFFLWAIEQKSGRPSAETLVDSQVVGAFEPKGELVITTPDPYSGGIPRTRIDKGFTLEYRVEGLLSSVSGAPASAQQVILQHEVANFREGYQHGGPEVDPALGLVGSAAQILNDLLLPGEEFDLRSISQNGTRQQVYPAGNIPGDDIYQDAGLETFKLFALADEVVAKSKIAEAQVQVWPVSKAEFVGIEAGESYGLLPEVRVELTGLYPSSKTWVQIYPGAEKLGKEGVKLIQSTIEVEDDVPRATSLVFRDLDASLTSDGLWTLEVLSETPFGLERLKHITISIGRAMELRGRFHSVGD